MPKDQIVFGALIVLLCLVALVRQEWLLANTRKGQALVRWLGEQRAPLALRAFLIAAALFGLLLALNIVRPIQW